MNRVTRIVVVGTAALVAAGSLVTAAQAAPQQGSARLGIVQAVPGQDLRLELDGETLAEDAATGEVVGPLTVGPGEHRVTVTTASGDPIVETVVDLDQGSTQDLVVHRPAEPDGKPVTTLYPTPTETISAGKARVLIAHTASVAPADVRLDGTVVFRNIANGEFATADVAAGAHVAELLPSGLTSRPILGPLDVDLDGATATMVYAVGNAEDSSMSVITHTLSLDAGAERAPAEIDAGSVGLASGVSVSPFGERGAIELAPTSTSGLIPVAWLAALALLAGGAIELGRRRAGARGRP